jgi:hypothetical protein
MTYEELGGHFADIPGTSMPVIVSTRVEYQADRSS